MTNRNYIFYGASPLLFIASCGCGPGEVRESVNGGSICVSEAGGGFGNLFLLGIVVFIIFSILRSRLK